MVVEDVSAALRNVGLFRDLAPVELETLAHQVIRKDFGRNELIFSQGARGDGLYFVASGHVSITRQNPHGHELILAVHVADQDFREVGRFGEEPGWAGATSIDECTALCRSRRPIRSVL